MDSPLFFNVQHNRWLVLGIASGLAVMLGIVLSYTAGWRPRKEEKEKAGVPLTGVREWGRWFVATFPWILIVTLLGITVWTFLYPILRISDPPNW